MKTVAVIQARMGSNRFPDKMMKRLGGIPLIEWVITRVKSSRAIDQIIVATTSNQRDKVLRSIASNFGVLSIGGSELDVMDRFLEASLITGAENIVRICADNPFIDPIEIDRLVKFFLKNKLDYAFNHQSRNECKYADGFGAEIFSVEQLMKINRLTNDASHREHVTKFFWDFPCDFRIKGMLAPSELSYPELRFDVDEESHLSRLQSLVDAGVTLQSSAADIIKVTLKTALQ